MKRIILIIAAIFTLQSINYAQDHIGISVGAGMNNISTPPVVDILGADISFMPSLQAGFLFEHQLNTHFSLAINPSWVSKGFQMKESLPINVWGLEIPLGARIRNRYDFIEIPVTLKYKTAGAPLRATFEVGPTVGYAVQGKLKTQANFLFDIDITNIDIPLGSAFNRWEIGATARAGLEWDTGKSVVFMNAGINRSFTELFDLGVLQSDIRNYSFAMNVGVKLPIR